MVLPKLILTDLCVNRHGPFYGFEKRDPCLAQILGEISIKSRDINNGKRFPRVSLGLDHSFRVQLIGLRGHTTPRNQYGIHPRIRCQSLGRTGVDLNLQGG